MAAHRPFRDIFWNPAGSMFADDLLAVLFDCQMCCTSVIRGLLKQLGGWWVKDLARSRIAALPRPEQNIIGQIDPCLHARMAPSGC